jgi:cobalt-zinc-cadmium efflux system membrane fusion protein
MHTDKLYYKQRNLLTMRSIIYLFILAIFVSSCKNEKPATEIKETFVLSDKMYASTKTEFAKKVPLQNELNFYGKITADNKKMIEIFPIVGGSVTKVYVELGDYVKKGQLLASIRSTEVAGFEKELEDAKNDLVVAKNNVKVAQELFDGKLATDREVLEAKSMLVKAQSQLHRINETYKIYNIREGSTFDIHAPINGFIIQKKINQDMILRNDLSDNIFDIAEIDQVWALANVNESDINLVKLGINAEVSTLSYPDKKFNGKVDKIFNIIDPETKAMKVLIKLDNPDYLLKPEMRATIKLYYTEKDSMIAVPSQAVIFDKSKSYVLIFKDRNNIETRQVEFFRQIGPITFISAGINVGEKVITDNQLLIYDALND